MINQQIKLKIKSLHLSCQSFERSHWKDNDIGGLIFYSKYVDNDRNLRISPGYVYIQSKANVENEKTGKGSIHGDLFKKLIGHLPEGKEIICGGFGRYKEKEWAFNSLTLNVISEKW